MVIGPGVVHVCVGVSAGKEHGYGFAGDALSRKANVKVTLINTELEIDQSKGQLAKLRQGGLVLG